MQVLRLDADSDAVILGDKTALPGKRHADADAGAVCKLGLDDAVFMKHCRTPTADRLAGSATLLIQTRLVERLF